VIAVAPNIIFCVAAEKRHDKIIKTIQVVYFQITKNFDLSLQNI
jgi:hypothetical protein